MAVIAGAAFDSLGQPELVVSPSGLDDALKAARLAPIQPMPAKAKRLPILVIDDSLTTRMLEQSILQSAGYDVDLAVSAEEALEKASERLYGLFIVDVEMPGMSGFEFVAHVGSSSDLRDIPSILVTSLGSREHRKRGMDVGAKAYFVKSEFSQGLLLDTVRRLVG